MVFQRTFVAMAALAVVLAGCASVHNEPANRPMSGVYPDGIELGREVASSSDDMLIGLAFSGGGTRAAAFSFGVLNEIDRTRFPSGGTLLDHVDFVSGVSGGSVLAAYYGLKKRAALADFRERFLIQDAEEGLSTEVSPITVVRALGGGANDARGFTRWLDRHLFDGATFAQLRMERRPRIWINAADIYNRTTFVFGRTAFTAICSDLDSYPVAEAVAASAAVPVVFAPIVVQSYADKCNAPLPDWIERARRNPAATPMLKSFADAMGRYRDGSIRYIKLLDGGLVDNYGLSGFTIARLSSDTPYGPLTPQQAVRLRRALFVVVDAGRAPSGDWTQKIEGPGGTELVMAAADTAIDASVRASFTAFNSITNEWQNSLIRWRCSLSGSQRAALGVRANWNCRDVKFFVGRVAFDQLGPDRAAELNAVPSRFKLPPQQVDLLIAAGGDALRGNALYREFLASLRGIGVPRYRAPIAPPPLRPAAAPVATLPSEPTSSVAAIQ